MNDVQTDIDKGRYPRWFGYAVAAVLGAAFIVILFYITWNTALEANRNRFTFESVTLKETIAHKVLVSNNIVDNIVAYINSQQEVTADQFRRFSTNLLQIYPFVTGIAYFPAIGPGDVSSTRNRIRQPERTRQLPSTRMTRLQRATRRW